MSDCKTNHARLLRLEGELHPSGKDYRCEDCGDVFEVDVKPATIGVQFGLAEQAPAGKFDARELELALRTAWREAPEDSPMAHADWNAVAGFVVKWAAGRGAVKP